MNVKAIAHVILFIGFVITADNCEQSYKVWLRKHFLIKDEMK